ncbi:cystin-1 [Cuculus canorus]|uniref:cystin-1 n=1 Tax=Cuculus canorus TaxID=55661 RepID=UPI0023AAC260|nr:cystin-1 [Cuculus canorus]
MGSGSSRRRGAAGAAAGPGNRDPLGMVLPEGEEAAALPGPGCGAPAAGSILPPARDIGGSLPPRAALSPRSPPGPENNTADHQCPQRNSKKPAGMSTISYDYSEEELMASIEREYCR